MGYNGPTPADTPQEVRQFERILSLFESRLSESKEISQGFYEKVCGLKHFSLETDSLKTEAKLKEPDGVINSLNQVIERIEYLNQRNIEILKHLNTLI